jgi:hypothetical protein
MKDDSELLERVKKLEEELENERSSKGKQAFMDKYGSKFGGDEGVGTAILAQLNRLGIDTSAADEAVQEIVDKLRTEANQLLEKLNAVSKAVEEATGETVPESAPVEQTAPVPPPEPSPAAPPPAAPPPAPAPDMGAPPPDMGAAPPAGGDMGVPSDLKLKTEIEDEKDPDEAIEDVQDDEGLDEEGEEDDELVPLRDVDIGIMSDEIPEEYDMDQDEADWITDLLYSANKRGR